MAHYFFPLILLTFFLCVGIGILYNIKVKLKFCAQPVCIKFMWLNIVSFLKIVHQNKNELLGTNMGFKMTVSRFEKRYCLLKSSVTFPWQPNLIKTLATGAISTSKIQTREPIPTYTLLNPISLLWTWHFKHGVYATNCPFPWPIKGKHEKIRSKTFQPI